MKKIIFALMSFCGIFSMNAWAIEEVIVTGYYTGYSTSDYSNNAYSQTQADAMKNMTRYGTTINAEAYAARAAAEKAACLVHVKERVKTDCEKQVETIKRASTESCNSGALSGGFAAAVGGIALAVGGILSAPVSVPILATIGVVGGGTLLTYSTTTCPTQTQWNFDDNMKKCNTYSNDMAQKVCSSM